MEINKVVVGPLETNCYILTINNDCLVIDPGDDYNKIKQVIGDKKVIGVIITHYHFDHVGALNYFDKSLILDKNNLEEKEYNIKGFNFEVIYTPGHKEDAVTIYFKKKILCLQVILYLKELLVGWIYLVVVKLIC
ncbi:MAG: MBL fold metallo-hydrolase [Bacilli bacterium]|nr:MBL fold metallo-hydrolase [Bacilli bacterium]